MERATADEKKSENMQYLLATKLLWSDDDELSVNSREVKYFSNINTKEAEKTCDGIFLGSINRINTKYNPKWTIENRAGVFLYGNEFREQLKNGGIFLIYSKFIPCAGLAASSFGECSGDLAAALKDLRKSYEVYFVIMYSDVYGSNNVKRGQTNECTSKLYHRLAGIPLLLCTQNSGKCEVAVGSETSFADNVVAPIFQSFPRVNLALQRKVRISDTFLFRLAKSSFLETLAGDQTSENDNAFQVKLKLIEDMIAFLSNPPDPNSPNIHNTNDMTLLFQRNFRGPRGLLAQEYGNHCETFINCLPNLKEGPPTILMKYGEMDAVTEEIDKNRKEFCARYAESLKVLGKSPELCRNKPNENRKKNNRENFQHSQ